MKIQYLLFAIILSACSAPVTEFPDEPVGQGNRSVYRIRSHDQLQITFVGEPNYDQSVAVDAAGFIDLGYLKTALAVSRIRASGRTPSQLMAAINTLAEKNKVLNNPRCQVLVTEANERTFVVLGQVGEPGRIAFPNGQSPKITIQEAIALADGHTRLANPKRIKVTRKGRVYQVNLMEILDGKISREFYIVPGDLIFVPERLF